MDLRLLLAAPTEAERAAVDAFLGGVTASHNGAAPARGVDGRALHGGHDARNQRHLLLPALEHIQARIGWISEGALGYICERLTVPPADAYGVASFYGLLSLEPLPPRVLHVCDDIVCQCRGADELIEALEQQIGPEGSDGGGCTWLRSPCLGQCDRAPAALVVEAGENPREQAIAPVGAGEALAAVRGEQMQAHTTPPPVPEQDETGSWLVRRVSVVDPRSLHDYRARGGYENLRRAMALGPHKVLREVKESGLMGRGGAAFPTGVKWEAVAQQPAQPHYLICNADESEPGTFKDRVLLEGDPFSVIEAMTIAAFATNCAHGYIYLRGEYPLALEILEEAIATARLHGYLGADILRSTFSFDIEIRRGAGAYICGEETAIFNSIEGFRGEPRSKPPFPVERGLFGMPTVVNNAETLVNVLEILRVGGREFAQTGTEKSTGTRLFCLSGHVARPGVYEAPFGQTLGELLERAGGVPDGRALQAVLLGGAAGGFVRPDELDMPLTFEDVRAAGATLGSGVVVAFDETVDLRRVLQRIAAFMRDESCGQCTPCRVGTVRQEEALARLVSGQTLGSVSDELAMLDELAICMRDSSICGLGQTAASALGSAVSRLGMFKEVS
ncbi:MAG TPA: NAD(P)H-dependent oxidoreductase subunit E [Solirubrobacteraceae bacterium]|nr:NAD(P)H-dependent oxidoreductase subunit E [Solirubrobacteraceae bacterium]HTT28688.1 NAD(P)H-dependent oxidoreductase subunit E [Solirubrobacteraceae bacterium]